MKPIAIHFGAGALGRGLIIPFLMESGFDVVTVDNDSSLITRLKESGQYEILLTDNGEKQHITILDALHPSDEALAVWLRRASVITTSVRKENLHFVAKQLKGLTPGTVICCENIEHSGRYFAGLMQDAGIDPQDWSLPDCMVDRICSAKWPDSLMVETESWGSVCVQSSPKAFTIKKFASVENIECSFQEKRILVNTYADGISFLGQAAGLKYLYEAAQSKEINRDIADYMTLMKRYLQMGCGYETQYLEKMAEKHRQRLANPQIKRSLESVARNFLEKLTPSERFIYPLISLQQRGVDIQPAIPFLNQLINGWAGLQTNSLQARSQALQKINNGEIVDKLENSSSAS